ncbi:Uncharacterized protein Rs2_07067 [Raphanus sativus]|uniref:Uncharacterized protein LOC108830993 isoform X1 n=1 Tax=Raphanus sativus TaxID=3726 RepID=A0A6J0LK30_RAPSA|nr:uncharacterized protein LOC108830993 isoform X1 [Raphanus sativus]XP_018460055.1 uncharacterized protein LOC108830993 isoform X2 [Raphanus sativus]KAJ4912446.1 Uncharacterized protein Rs2_07067 [Raphanus sativus]
MAHIPAPVNAFNLQDQVDVDEAMAQILHHSQFDWLSQAEMLAIYAQHEHFEMSHGKFGPAPPIQEGLYFYDSARFSDRYQWTQVPGARRRNCVSGPTIEGQLINYTEARVPVPNGSFRRRNHHHVDDERLCLVHYQIRAPDGGPAVVADEDGDSESDESSEDDSESDDSSEEESEEDGSSEDSSDNDDPQEGEQVTVSGALALDLIEQSYAVKAWGEAALLLTAGAKGNRSASPPIARFQGQATDVETARKEIRHIRTEMVKLPSKHIGKSPEQIEADLKHPEYFSPSEAVEDGIFDKVVYNERISQDKGVLLSRFSAGNTPDVSFDNSPTEEHVRGSLDSVADKFGERRPRRAFV